MVRAGRGLAHSRVRAQRGWSLAVAGTPDSDWIEEGLARGRPLGLPNLSLGAGLQLGPPRDQGKDQHLELCNQTSKCYMLFECPPLPGHVQDAAN